MTMRQAAASDLPLVNNVTRRAYAHYVALFGGDPIPVTENYAPRIAAGEVWLLEDAGEAIGLIVIEDEPDRLVIYSVAVVPERQGEGLGHKLLAFAEELALERKRGLLALYTNSRMERNIALYQRAGFVESGRRPNPQRPGWVLVDMEKRLTRDDRKGA